ncbi:hypothetical protein [Aliarcobacter cryaerophilus]|uniref:hypothetical protein n=1 Tax=Aliarcobacter cryaerophilus TaxID=28198 RepID=UPI0021B5E7EC|nr:hypothetical protein [Aliarcobacter cryaerophilus]MCT7473524.1 hypothetical protein [Aliarcobacter cryaerophilus]
MEIVAPMSCVSNSYLSLLSITGNNSTEFDMRTGDVAGNKTNVDTTILDNSNPLNPGGEDGGYGSEDIVFAIIEGTTTVNEGDTAQYVVKLVDKDGNPVTVTKDTEVTIKYTNKTTQDGDTEYNNNDTIKITIKAGENSSDKFDVDTIDDYLADNGEKFNLEITNVDDQGQFEKVNIGDINGDKTNVDTTILDNSKDTPNDPYDQTTTPPVEGDLDTITIKLFALDKDGNRVPANEVAEGSSASYVAVAFDKNGVELTLNETVEVTFGKTGDSATAGGVDYDSTTQTVTLGKPFSTNTVDDYLADNGEKYSVQITDKTLSNATKYETVVIDTTSVTTTILDNTTDKPNENSTVESNQENVILKIVAADKDGNPIKDANGDYLTQNEVPEGNNAYYVVLAFEPNTTKFNDNTKLDIQSGTVEVQTFDKNATGTTTQTKEDGTQDYISKTEKFELGKVISVETLDDWKADNGEQYEIKITDKSYEHPTTGAVYENVVTDKNPVTTTIEDNTTDKPNDPSTTETNGMEKVILKIVAVGEDGNPIIKDGKYTFENNVAEGSNAKYMVLAFKPGTTEFKTTDVVDTQGGTVTIKTTDDTAKTTGTKDNAELDYVSETSKTVTLGEVFEIKTLDDYLKDDGEKYKVSINDKTYEHPASGAIYENVVTNTDPVTTTIKDNTTPNTETNVEDVKIVLVAVSSATTTIADITNSDGTLKVTSTNETPEGGKLYYIAVAVDKDGKPLATQGGDVTINYGTTSNTSDKDATAGVDYDNTTKVNTKVGVVFEVKTKDDYYAEGDENFTVKITDLKNSSYETPSIDTTKDTVTSTIKDNVPVKNHQVDNIGGIDGTVYGKEDTVYVKIEGNPTVVEGGEVEYTVKLVDSTGKEVKVTSDTKVTVTFGTNNSVSDGEVELKGTPNNNPLENGKNITITIPKNGNSASFTIKTKDDFTADNNETFNLKITDIDSKEFENIVYDDNNGINTTIKDGVTLGTPKNAYVDEDNFYVNDLDGTNGGSTNKTNISDKQSLGIIKNGETDFKLSFESDSSSNPIVTVQKGRPEEGSNPNTLSKFEYKDGSTTLTSDGNEIKYKLVGTDKIVAYTGTEANYDKNKVFEITLEKDNNGKYTGDYKYTQYKNIDHPVAGDATDPINDDNITFEFGFKITDQDSTSSVQTFKVTVNDSTPIAGEKTLTIYEDNNGQTNGAYTFVLSDESFKNGSIEIDNGKDGYQTVAKDGTVNIYDGDEVIGVLKNNANGTLTFKPNLDYSKYEADNGYLPNFKYKVSDTDGDYAQGQINIHVKPVADGTTIKVENVTTYEDNKNTQEGQNSVSLGLVQPTIKDNTDQNNGAKGDHGERVDYITLKFTNGTSVNGAILEKADGTDIATISSNNQTVKIVIVKADGSVDTDFHHSNIALGQTGVVYLTKEEYEGLKIQHAEDNDTDIVINISTRSYEVNDSGEPLSGVNSKSNNSNMTVVIKPVTDDISLKWNDESVGTISDGGKTYTFNDIDEGNPTIDLKALLTKTSGTELNDGTTGNKADLDGSEKRTYTISGIPEGTVVTLGGQTAVANDKGIATIVFNDTNNKNPDPDFSMKFPENYSGTVEGKITLSVQDKGFKSNGTTNENKADWGEVKTAEVDFKVNVYPVADEATLKVSQAVGYEDAGRSQGNISNGSDASKVDQPEKGISLDIKVSSTDTDGSETITINIDKIPSGGYIYYKGGLYDENGFVSGTKTDGISVTKTGSTWSITVPEYNNESPKFIPPHNSDEEYNLEVTAQTVDTAIIDDQEVVETSTISSPKIIEVIVKGVADIPVGTELNNDGNENAYTVAENDLDSSGNKFDLKVIYKDASKLDSYDNDGSEELSIVIKGLPDGFSVEGALPTGDGEWAFNAKDLDKIKITTPSNFSGEASFTLTYVTTEREGNSKVHYTQDVNIYINPEIDSTLNGQSVGNEDEVVTINLNLIHNNGDTDETLEEVKISVDDVTGKDFTLFIGGVDIKDAGLTIKDGYYILTPVQAKTITAEGKENVSGEYEFDVKYTVKDVANDGKAEIKEFDATHNLVINPVTDQPTIDFGTIEVTGSNITVNGTDIKIVGDKKSTIEIPVETTSPDTDGSEKVVEIRIEGVPAGVKVVGGESSTEALEISQNNGVWTIKVDETITDINEIIKNIKFEIDSDAKFSHREITITTVTQDKNAETKEASKTITIDYDKAPGTGGGTGEAANFSLVAKDFIVTEDKEFRLTNLFDIKTNGGEVEGTSWTITLTDLPEGTIINGTVIGADGKYVIESKLDGQDIYDIESIISNIKITPPANLNDYDNSTKSMTITATIETKVGQTVISTSEVENDSTILPVTDKMTVTVDAVNEIDESGSFEFEITLSSTGDNESRTAIVGETIVITVSENFESGETATGELLYNGQVLTPNANGQYEIEVPTGYKFGDKIEGLEYKSGEQRHGNVTITASIKHQETEAHDNYKTNVENASGSATVNVKPVLDANPDNIKITANSVEDTIIDVKIDDTKFITDNSENLINVIFNDIPKDFIVYYKDANGNSKMAVNTGNGKWLIPIVDGKLPDGIQIKAPENYSGEFKFNMDFYIKEEGLDLQKITKEATVNVTPIADGVIIDPTLSGIQDDGSYAKAFEWTNLNLNANMKDIDGSETLTLKFDGLSQNAQFRVLNEDGTSKSLDAVYENGKWTINGINVDDINNIQLLHDKEATVKVTASTVDTATDENGNPVGSSSTSTEVKSTFDLRIDSSDIDNGKFTLGKEVNIDFSKIESGDIKDVSTIDLGAQGENKLLNLTLQDVMDIGKKDLSGNINLTILGDANDSVSFAKDNGWQKSETTITENGKTFTEWSNTGDENLKVKVEQPISDGITN